MEQKSKLLLLPILMAITLSFVPFAIANADNLELFSEGLQGCYYPYSYGVDSKYVLVSIDEDEPSYC